MHPWNAVQGLIDARSGYDHLSSICVPIAIGAFTLMVLVAFAVTVIRLRRPPKGAIVRRHKRNPLQGSYTVLLLCVAGLLLYLTITAGRNVDPAADQQHPSVVIKVVGSQASPSRTAEPLRRGRLTR